MIDVNPIRCMRAADEMLQIQNNLRHESYEIEYVIAALKRTDEDAMQIAAAKLERYLSALLTETRAAAVMGDMLNKVSETYLRVEQGLQEYLDEIPIVKPIYATYYISGISNVTTKSKEIFEEF